MKKIAGVYAWKVNGVVKYVGSGKDITNSRKSNHLARLRKGKHCKGLQELYDKYGEKAFEFIVLEECNVQDLYNIEQKYMKLFKNTIVNENEIKNTYKKKRTGLKAAEHKQKLREIMKGENNPNAKLSENDVANIRYMINHANITYNTLSDYYKVKATEIGYIHNKIRWKDVIEKKDNTCKLWNKFKEIDKHKINIIPINGELSKVNASI